MQDTVPVTLTYEGQFMLSGLSTTYKYLMYKFQIDISSNSREIKYQNIGRTHIHTQTHTDRPGENNTSQPLWGRGNNCIPRTNLLGGGYYGLVVVTPPPPQTFHRSPELKKILIIDR